VGPGELSRKAGNMLELLTDIFWNSIRASLTAFRSRGFAPRSSRLSGSSVPARLSSEETFAETPVDSSTAHAGGCQAGWPHGALGPNGTSMLWLVLFIAMIVFSEMMDQLVSRVMIAVPKCRNLEERRALGHQQAKRNCTTIIYKDQHIPNLIII